MDGFVNEDAKKWVLEAGIAVKSTNSTSTSVIKLPSIITSQVKKNDLKEEDEEEEEEGCSCKTPKSEKSRIPSILVCPPAPKKRKATSMWGFYGNNGVRHFFNPPDLESVFICRIEKA